MEVIFFSIGKYAIIKHFTIKRTLSVDYCVETEYNK